jgi:Tol biopolymer transport system component
MRTYQHLKILILSGLSIFLFNCVAPTERIVPIELIEVQEIIEKSDDMESVEITFTEEKTFAYIDVIEKSPNVRSVSRVTNNDKDEVYYGFFDYSPIDDIIVYSMTEHMEIEQGENNSSNSKDLSKSYISNIWKQRIGSHAKTRLTYGKRIDIGPSFTKNGKKVVFSSNRSGRHTKIWMLNIDGGGGLRLITSTPAEDYSPYASRADNMIAYTSIPDGSITPQIWTIDNGGRLATQLREGKDPRISPDGKWLTFLKRINRQTCKDSDEDESPVYQIWKMTTEGNSETQLTMNDDYCVMDAMWSPDGKWIVFSSNENEDSNKRNNYDIWMMASDGTQRVQLTTNGSMDILPTFDRTGQLILFVSNRGGKWNIWQFKPVLY